MKSNETKQWRHINEHQNDGKLKRVKCTFAIFSNSRDDKRARNNYEQVAKQNNNLELSHSQTPKAQLWCTKVGSCFEVTPFRCYNYHKTKGII